MGNLVCDDAEWTAVARYDRARPGRRVCPFFVDHHPVIRSAGFMCARRIGTKRCIPAFSAMGPQDRQPCGVSGTEPARRDHAEPSSGHPFAKLAVHIKQLGDGWCFGRGHLRGPDSSQTRGERVSNSRQPLGARAGRMFKPTVVDGGFQFFQGRDAQVLLQMLHPHRAESGYCLQHKGKRPPRMIPAHGPRQTLADIQRVPNAEFSLFAKDFLNRPGQPQ